MVTLIALLVIFAGCKEDFRSRGPITSEKRELNEFTVISSNAMAEVIIVYDSARYVSVTTNKNLLPQVTTEVDGKELQISVKKGFSSISNLDAKVEVHTPDLSQINLNGVGSIQTQGNFNFNHVSLNLQGVGGINLSGTARVLRIKNEGTGSIDVSQLKADSVYATTAGIGSINCYAATYLNASVRGIGSISYKGNPVVEKSVEGIGSISKEKE